ncbi:MAG: hypothetical protein K0R18_387 [Bacillales bacterium]|jgi:hypothetical protein|nr:hypothetical protein [Bacillales bacterium]
METNYEQQALFYAEKYGIIEYLVRGSKMIYRENFPIEGSQYKVTVNLKTGTQSRVKYKKKVPTYITSRK